MAALARSQSCERGPVPARPPPRSRRPARNLAPREDVGPDVRIAFAAALALLSVLCLAAPAGAAMAVRILVTPVRPVAGQAATVSVQTLAPFTQKCIDDPTADYRPWSEWQTSDGGTLRLAAQAGAAAEACADARITVVVDERLPSTTTDGPPDVAPAAYASAVAAAPLMMLARRRHLQQRR